MDLSGLSFVALCSLFSRLIERITDLSAVPIDQRAESLADLIDQRALVALEIKARVKKTAIDS